MPLKLNFASLSLGASVDQQTGNLSVFDIVEEIRTPQVPVQLQALVISLALLKEANTEFKGKIFIHLLTPDAKQVVIGNGEIHVPAEQRRMRAVFRFGSFPVHNFGAHRFVVSWLDAGNRKIGEALLDFDVVQATQVAQGVTPSEKPSFVN
jgi:hypothetical protein